MNNIQKALSYYFSFFLLAFSILNAGESLPIKGCHHHAQKEKELSPCVIVIFGATGDLTARKLLPAIYHLGIDRHLPENIAVVGFARKEFSHSAFRKGMGEAIDQFSETKSRDEEYWNYFQNRLFYNQGDFADDQGYENLAKHLLKIDQDYGTQGNRIYYLATSPSYFPLIIEKLYKHQLIGKVGGQDKNWSRVLIEKPFGSNVESAVNLQQHLSTYLDEGQIYRIDHYLGKQGVQNILALRAEGGLFEPLWNNQYIDNVQITLSEVIGIENRAKYWEETGALKDFFQNHLMQLLSLIAMDLPLELTADEIRAEKLKVLNSVRPFPVENIDVHLIRGQYGSGIVHGIGVPGYKQEKDIPDTSVAETFVAAKIFIDNPRWKGVPFYIRGGKRLSKRTTEIAITFKSLPGQISNALFINIQPKTGVYLRTLSKVPGLKHQVLPVIFGYCLDSYFEKSSPEAYEKIFYDSIRGDGRLFVSFEEQLAAWRILEPVLTYWKTHLPEFPNYDAGTWGPAAADQLLQENGHRWELLD